MRFGSRGPALKPGITTLYEMMRRHATYPFWTEVPDRLCEDAFIRVLALLRSEPYSQIHSSGCSTGSWGEHMGVLVTYRQKTAQDHKRRLFRGMAEQTKDGLAIPIQIAVPRFEYFEELPHSTPPIVKGDGTALDEAIDSLRRVLVVEHEDERSVELLDILSKTEPGKSRKVRSPLRESYSIVVPTLLDIHKLPHLSQLGLRRTAFRALMTLLIAVDSVHRGGAEWATTIDAFSLHNGTNIDMTNIVGHSTTYIQWKDIDSAVPNSFVCDSVACCVPAMLTAVLFSQVQIFPLVSKLTDMFIKPSVW